MAVTSARSHFAALFATAEPPELGPGPRAGVLSLADLRQRIASGAKGAGLTGERADLIRALAFLWHDHLEPAHEIAQQIDDADGSFVHAIMHRREPDYSNSKYWWRRVGNHPCFPALAQRVDALLRSKNEQKLASQLIRAGLWDPFAFVDACEEAAGRPASAPHVQLLRSVQAIEFEVLRERFCGS
jgi:hypothetical protein